MYDMTALTSRISLILTLGLAFGIIVVFDQGSFVEGSKTCGYSTQGNTEIPLYHHVNTTNGHTTCCENIVCIRGTEAIFCTSDSRPHETSCRECPEGEYQEVEHESRRPKPCKKKKNCEPKIGLKVDDEGTTYEDRTCICDLERGFYKDEYGDCSKRKCEQGTQLNKSGLCETCKYGYHKPTRGYERCVPVKHCESPLEFGEWSPVNGTECINTTVMVPSSPKTMPSTSNISSDTKVLIYVFSMIILVLVCVGIAGWCLYKKRRQENVHITESGFTTVPGSPTPTDDADSGVGVLHDDSDLEVDGETKVERKNVPVVKKFIYNTYNVNGDHTQINCSNNHYQVNPEDEAEDDVRREDIEFVESDDNDTGHETSPSNSQDIVTT